MDHAAGFQKAQIVHQIVANSLRLVDDPFGNYVLQYIVDLQAPVFINALIVSFQGRVVQLSKQKFASNVVEKLLRGATLPMGRLMIEEILHDGEEIEKLCKDGFANYVIQTALDYSDPEIKLALVEAIRPLLPSLRGHQNGRRIQQKITGSAGSHSGGMSTPVDSSTMSFRRGAPVRLGPQGPLNGFPAVMGPEPYQVNSNRQSQASSSTLYSQGSETDAQTNGTVHQPQPTYARQPMGSLNYF